MPSRRAPRRPRRSSFLDGLDFEWLLVPWDALWSIPGLAWRSARAGFRSVREALAVERAGKWLVLLLLAALCVRLWRPDWYAGRTFHPDERWIFEQTAPLSWPQEPGQGDAAGLQYGSLPLYAVGALKDAAVHVFKSPANDAVIVWGRSLTGCVDVLTVLGVFLLAWQLAGILPAFLAAFIIACAPLNILFSHFFTVDPWLACFATLTLAACVAAARRPGWGWSAVCGVLYAAALASKSSGLPLALPVALAQLWPALAPGLASKERRSRFQRGVLGLGAAAVATLAAFFVFMPWAFLDFHKFLDNQTAQQNILVTGSPLGTPYVRQYWDTGIFFHLKNVCLFYLGLPTGLLALLAVPLIACLAALKAWRAWVPRRGRTSAIQGPRPRQAALPAPSPRGFARFWEGWNGVLGPLLLLAWVLPYFAIVSFSFAKFARYMLPVLPALATLLALALAWLGLRWRRFARALTALVVLGSLGYGSGYFLTYLRPHPWLEASAWTYDHIPVTVADPAAPGGRRHTRILNEDWGDDLPLSVEGHWGGYDDLKDRPGQVNVVEWDSVEKLNRFCASLSQADVLFLADPRAYGTYLRLPHRFPLTHAYYTLLFSDPGRLGFRLAHEADNPLRWFGFLNVPDSRTPAVPQWRWADESFTLYDRPHAFIFQRDAPKTPDEIRAALLGEVNALGLSDGFLRGMAPDEMQAAYEGGTPGQAPASVSAAAAAAAAAAGIPSAGAVNPNFGRSRGALVPLGPPVLVWWLLVAVLGWLALPLTVRLFSGFPAGGYALSRALGIFLFAWLAYNLALLFPGLLPFWQSRLWLLLAALAALATWSAWPRRRGLAGWIRDNRTELLWTEAVFVCAFLFFVVARAYNPDIHDVEGQGYFGGGEPLGMTYLSALTRCATFPAYDPWLCLANSSYYYFGYVLAATLTKLSGIPPAITYNLSLALFFSLTLLSAYGLLRALVSKRWLALGGAVMASMAGSLWTVAYIALRGREGVPWWDALFSHGFIWDPSRFPELVSGHIFEFPFFSYLYGDLHPHNIILGFSILLAALFLKPFLARESGWRAFGGTPVQAALWLAVTALLLDAQYAINTWSWPVFLGLGAACMFFGPWVGKGLGARPVQIFGWSLSFGLIGFAAGSLMGVPALAGTAGWLGVSALAAGLCGLVLTFLYGAGFASLLDFLSSLGLLVVVLLAGRVLMSGFRHFFLQNGANRVGTVQPGEWQMSAYIPLAYYFPGLLALAALGGLRLRAWTGSLAKPLGYGKLGREDFWDKAWILGERWLTRFPLSSGAVLSWGLCVAWLVLWATAHWQFQGVWAVSLGLGLACLGLFLLGGFAQGAEAWLWVLGGCFCFMVCGIEFRYVADRMNTIFKVWMNGWIFMSLAFGAAFAPAFERGTESARNASNRKAPKRKGRRARRPGWSLWVSRFSWQWTSLLAAGGLVFLAALAAFCDARLLDGGGRFLVSYLVFGLLLLAVLVLGMLYGRTELWHRVLRGLFYGLLVLGLLYPLGAVVERIREASQFKNPHLDGVSFMAQREARPGPNDDDYDRHDYALISWLNRNADLTETVAEAPGLELYRGFSRFSIYTGLPTLLGWDYQVGQQLGERTGNTLTQREQDAAAIYGQDPAAAAVLLKRYHVRWIVVGSLERKLYAAPGLDKFKTMAAVADQDGPSILYRYDWDKP